MRQPVFFVSHGGGPWPWMAEARAAYAALSGALAGLMDQLPTRPAAIAMVSAHWITHGAIEVGGNPHPGMIYDYHGFPAHTYGIQYPAPGAPVLATNIVAQLKARGITAGLDPTRGFDHGVFVPAYVMAPQADIPVVPISIEADFDPAAHVALGHALGALRDQNVLVIGSGLSYHNLRLMGPQGKEPSARFDAWLQSALVDGPADHRIAELCDWEKAPAARLAHPQEDHLMPLHVAVGAAGGDAALCFHHETHAFGGITVSSFRFG